MCDYRRGMDWWINLLPTYAHHSQLQVITAVTLISTIHKSLHAKSFPACSDFNSHSLTAASNSGDSPASRAQVLLSEPLVQKTTLNSTTAPSVLSLACTAQLTVCPSSLLISSRRGPGRQHTLHAVVCVSVVAGTCLPSCCPEISLI
jgi:hypothetical protein